MTHNLGMARLSRTGKRILIDDAQADGTQPLPADNVLTVGLPASVSYLLDAPRDTGMLYLFETPEAQADYRRRVLEDGHVDLYVRNAGFRLGGLSMMEKFWRRAPKSMLLAIQFTAVEEENQFESRNVVRDGQRYVEYGAPARFWNRVWIEYMGVRSSWRGGRLMLSAFRTLLASYPGRTLAFSDPTPLGLATIRSAVRAGLPVVMPTQMDGGGPVPAEDQPVPELAKRKRRPKMTMIPGGGGES